MKISDLNQELYTVSYAIHTNIGDVHIEHLTIDESVIYDYGIYQVTSEYQNATLLNQKDLIFFLQNPNKISHWNSKEISIHPVTFKPESIQPAISIDHYVLRQLPLPDK